MIAKARKVKGPVHWSPVPQTLPGQVAQATILVFLLALLSDQISVTWRVVGVLAVLLGQVLRSAAVQHASSAMTTRLIGWLAAGVWIAWAEEVPGLITSDQVISLGLGSFVIGLL